jgi:hypothetical protein
VIPTDTSLITEEYVEQVLDALYEVSLQAVLAAREAGDLVELSIRLLEATSTPESAANRITSLADDIVNGFADYHPEPQPVDADVIAVLEASSDCILAEAKFDSSGMVTTPDSTAGFRIFARLSAATVDQRSTGLNPTAWVLDELPATDDGSIPSGCNE